VGETLNLSGGKITLDYDDYTKRDIALEWGVVGLDISHEDFSTPGVKTVWVEYKDFEGTFTVLVSEDVVTLVLITVSKTPTKTLYEVGDSLDPEGGELNLVYDKGPSQKIAMTTAGVTFDYNPFASVGVKSITVKYEGKTAVFSVTIDAPKKPDGYGEGVGGYARLKEAPDFTVYKLDGTAVKLSDYYGKKPVFISFWATWCGPCKAEMPHFRDVYNEMSDKFEILAVNIYDSASETPANISSFMQSNNYKFLAVYDKNRNVSTGVWNTGFVPANYMVDKWGYLYNSSNPVWTASVASFNVGTMANVNAMKTIVNGAINRVANYKPPA